MFVKQLSVFIENREGRLEEVTETLKENNINVLSLSLADTSEYGLLRMIVSEPEKGKQVLREAGFSAMLTDVIAVRLENKVGTLQSLLKVICQANINIEYMYALATSHVGAMILKIKTADVEAAMQILQNASVDIVSEDDLYQIQ